MVRIWPRTSRELPRGSLGSNPATIFSTALPTLPRSRRSTLAYTSNTGCTL